MSHIKIEYADGQIWKIINQHSGDQIGIISVYIIRWTISRRWRRRRLVLAPTENTVWTWDCLQEVADFMKEKEKELAF